MPNVLDLEHGSKTNNKEANQENLCRLIQQNPSASKGTPPFIFSGLNVPEDQHNDNISYSQFFDEANSNHLSLFRINKTETGIFQAQSTYSPFSEVAQSYSLSRLFLCDPLLIHSLMNLKPILWSRSEESDKRLSIISPHMFNMIRRFDLQHVITIPWKINHHQIGIMRLASTNTNLPFTEDLIINKNEISSVSDELLLSVYSDFEQEPWEDIEIRLTRREQDILTLYSLGETIDSVARYLGRSNNTINTHTKNIFEKLSVNNRQHAILKAHAFGLIDYSISF